MADHIALNPESFFHPMEGKLRRQSGFPVPDEEPDYRQHANNLRGILEGLESRGERVFPNSEGEDTELLPGRVVLKVTGAGPIEPVLRGVKMTPMGQAEDKSIYCLTDEQSRKTFALLVDKYVARPDEFLKKNGDHESPHAWRKALANINGIDVYDREDRARPLSSDLAPIDTYQIVLWPTSIATRSAQRLADERIEEVKILLQDENIMSFDNRPEYVSITARLSIEDLEQVLENSLVEQVRVVARESIHFSETDFQLAPPEGLVATGTKIGVLDDMVTTVNPWIEIAISHAPIAPHSVLSGQPATDHGNVTTGIAAYGQIDSTTLGTRPPHPIIPARIMCSDSSGRPTLYDEKLVETQIRWLAQLGVRIMCLAATRGHSDDGALPDTWSAMLDSLAHELDVLIIVPSGNVPAQTPIDWFGGYPGYTKQDGNRVAAPGTAISAVTVGALACGDRVDPHSLPSVISIARQGEVAPYSRTAPGRKTSISVTPTIKPEFALPSGNWAYDTGNGSLRTDVDALGLPVLIGGIRGRHFGFASGTSYSAAQVAHEAAEILDRYPTASSSMIRCLLALSAHPLPPNQQHSGHWGLPDARAALDSDSHRVIVTFESSITANGTAFLQIPIPLEFASTPGRRRFRVAVAYAPPVLRTRSEYLAGHIEFDLTNDYSIDELNSIYSEQPSKKQIEEDPTLVKLDLPRRWRSIPNKKYLGASTLQLREFRTTWDPDNSDYTIIVRHVQSPWSGAQRRRYVKQEFAVAVEMIHEGQIELYNAVQQIVTARNEARTQVRI